MEKLTLCRICLVENVRMHAITDVQLQETFEMLNNIPFVTEDSRPVLACFFCYARLKQCDRLTRKCLEAEQAFTQILNGDFEQKPYRKDYFGGFIRTSIENIDIVDSVPDLLSIKGELSIKHENVNVKEEDIIDGDTITNSCLPNPLDKMGKLTMCRICLVENVRMHIVTDLYLQETFERLNNIPFVTEDSRPVLACFFCYARLTQCCRFMTQCWQAEQAFTQILNGDYEQKPCRTQYFGGFIRTAIENIDIVEVATELVLVKEELPIGCATDKDVYIKDVDDIDGTQFDWKPKQDVLKPYVNKRKGNGQTNMNDIEKTKSNKCKTVPKPEQPCMSDVTKLIANNSIGQNTDIFLVKKHKVKILFDCDFCQKSFNKKSYFERHILTHTGEKPFKCDICHKSFTQSGSLHVHIRTHTGKKPYKCDTCQKSYGSESQLHTHICTRTVEKIYYKCDICNYSCTGKKYLLRHIRSHSIEKPYKCDQCHRRFTQKHHLRGHIHTHNGERPYKCHICQRRFALKSYLRSHFRRHTDPKLYKCHMCPSSSNRTHNLENHSHTH